MEKEILIFGHKNPDTDSICSSIVKEKLDRKSGKENIKAVRLGNINKETRICFRLLKNRWARTDRKCRRGTKGNISRS